MGKNAQMIMIIIIDWMADVNDNHYRLDGKRKRPFTDARTRSQMDAMCGLGYPNHLSYRTLRPMKIARPTRTNPICSHMTSRPTRVNPVTTIQSMMLCLVLFKEVPACLV